MRAERIQLQNVDGSHCRWIGERELQQMIATGEVARVSRRRDPVKAYRKRQRVQASESRATAACITIADTRAVAGLQRVDEIWVERLIGLNLVPEGTMVPACGFLA